MVWWEEGVEQITEAVFRMPLPLPGDGLRAVNVYAIRHSQGIVLIDSGWPTPEARDSLSTALGRIGAELGDVTHILATHIHRDHYALGVMLRDEFGMRLALGEGERRGLKHMQNATDPSRWESQVPLLERAGAQVLIEALARRNDPPVELREWRDPDEWLQDDQVIQFDDRRLEVVRTPGHTRGHVVFVDESDGLIFTGDHILPHITPSIGFETGIATSLPLGDFLASLELMLKLSDLRMMPAHGDVRDRVHPRVRELQEHHAQRFEATMALLGDTPRSGYEVAQDLRWTRRERHFDELDVFNQVLATMETQAHLDVLETRRAVTRSMSGPIASFARVAPA